MTDMVTRNLIEVGTEYDEHLAAIEKALAANHPAPPSSATRPAAAHSYGEASIADQLRAINQRVGDISLEAISINDALLKVANALGIAL